jgi:hypothetical protein
MSIVKEYWLFASTEEAHRYGQYCSDKPHIVMRLQSLRSEILRDIGIEKSRPHRDSQKMMNLAVQAQFHREAIDEAKRRL